jgi:hypothetical protein
LIADSTLKFSWEQLTVLVFGIFSLGFTLGGAIVSGLYVSRLKKKKHREVKLPVLFSSGC